MIVSLLVVLLMVFPFIAGGTYYVHVIWLVFFYVILAQSWNICGGFCGLPSLGHSAFFGIGAYISALLSLYGLTSMNILTVFAGGIIGGILAGLLGFGLGLLCAPLRGPGFCIGTVAFLKICAFIMLAAEGVTGGANGLLLSQPPLYTKNYSYLILLGVALLVNILTYWINKSKIGLGFAAIRDDEDAAEATGVNVVLYKGLSVGMSAIFPAVAGSLYVIEFLYIDPYISFSVAFSLELIVISSIGGKGSVFGPIIGAAILVPVDQLFLIYYPLFHAIFYGFLLILVTRFMPDGIMGYINKLISRQG